MMTDLTWAVRDVAAGETIPEPDECGEVAAEEEPAGVTDDGEAR